ncbi:MAG: transposase [Actinomycetota bacterium]|nr:transposase [Actinomycetota bacterium]
MADPPRELRAFRERLYASFDRRADALFELSDAILTAGAVAGPVHLSLQPAHRRCWTSLYAALRHGWVDEASLRDLLARQPPMLDGDGGTPLVFAVDQSVWPRCDAETSPGRGYHYHPSRHSAGQPIVAGWSYQLVAGLGFERDSWVTPVDARRVGPEEDANDVAVEQVKALIRRLGRPERSLDPLFVFDAGYDPVRLQRNLGGCHAQVLVRLHSGRTFYADPPKRDYRPVGQPFRHSKKFSCKDSSTWHRPTGELPVHSAGYGSVHVRAWAGLHPKTRRAAERYGATTAAVATGTVILVEVERLPRGERRRTPKMLWLWWYGPGEPDLELLWRSYCRRFDVEHFVRFLKQKLGWTTPRFRHPEQADLWTWLVLTAYAQLRLARGFVTDRRLPWERPLPAGSLTPARVLRSFATLLPLVGTLAKAPKPRGRSPGRPKGSLSGPARRYPTFKKAA